MKKKCVLCGYVVAKEVNCDKIDKRLSSGDEFVWEKLLLFYLLHNASKIKKIVFVAHQQG